MNEKSAPLLEAHALEYAFPKRETTILQGASLALRPGELTVLLGANGSGKSTLLRLLAGILSPKSGEVRLLDAPLRGYSPRKRAALLGIALQSAPTPLENTVREMALLGRTPLLPRLLGPRPEDWSAADQALRLMGLSEFAERRANTLSGGEYQRLQTAALLALNPRVLLLDEPTSAQDPAWTRRIFTLLKNKAEKEGRAILVVTHDLERAREFASQCLLLKTGRIWKAGKPEEVLKGEDVEGLYG